MTKCAHDCTCARHTRIAVNLAGRRFGRLIAVAEEPRGRGNWRVMWRCKCDCGKTTVAAAGHLTGSRINSCGCIKREMLMRRQTTHGLSKTPTYKIWGGIIKRCTNPNSKNWSDYGGRGIAVCDRWRAFENFLADMGERPPGRSIERRDNTKGYSKDNCTWATHLEQMNNTRRCKPVTFNGRVATVSMLAREHGLNPKMVLEKVRRGRTVEQALGLAP